MMSITIFLMILFIGIDANPNRLLPKQAARPKNCYTDDDCRGKPFLCRNKRCEVCKEDAAAICAAIFDPYCCDGVPYSSRCQADAQCARNCVQGSCGNPGSQCTETGCKSCDISGSDACNSGEIKITSCDPNTCPTVRIGCDAGFAPFNVGDCCGCYQL